MASIVAVVREVLPATPRTRIIRLDAGSPPLAFEAGQAVSVGLEHSPLRKPYSLACAPSEAARTGLLELLVQVDEPGPDPHLERAVPGTRVAVEGPFGRFVLPPDLAEPDVLFVAGGTGIAPLRAMIRTLLARPAPPRLHLLYSARRADEFAYAEELRDLAARGRLDLRFTVTRDVAAGWQDLTGRVGAEALAALLPGPDVRCFVCGPPSLVADVTALLEAAGVPRRLVSTER
ncbi:MAG: hypothetical protein AB1635_12115 [Acidobacteriota bacterium]